MGSYQTAGLRPRCQKMAGTIVAFFLFCLTGTSTSLMASPSHECIAAAQAAAQKTGVPFAILSAIARTETGRDIGGSTEPWPWAMNLRGRGSWFADKDQVLEAALEQISKGERMFDLGCFQINYHWHSSAFDSLDEMISPRSNALYAANFLKALFHETGDWTKAAGFYHSRTEELANAYLARLSTHLDSAQEHTIEPSQTDVRSNRSNRFPLLVADGGKPHLGSLVVVTSP